MNTPAVSGACLWHMLLKMQKNSLENPSVVFALSGVERGGVIQWEGYRGSHDTVGDLGVRCV